MASSVDGSGISNNGAGAEHQSGSEISSEIKEAQRLLDEGQQILENSVSLSPARAIQECDRAMTIFKRARQLAGDDPEVGRAARLAVAATYSQRGHQNRYRNNYSESLADLSQAIRLNPADALDYYYRALSYLKNGDKKLARADFTEYLKRGEDDFLRESARNKLAALVPGKEDSQATLLHWRNEGTRLNSEASNALNPRGEDARPDWPTAIKLYNQALEAFNKALEASPNDMMTKISMITSLKDQAEAYRNVGEYDLAIANYDRALQLRFDPRYLFMKGETLWEAGHREFARSILQEYLAKGREPDFRSQAEKYLAMKDK
ncbi:MAG TPA: tetratricopeptide repeat protein [Chloroflexia bacterium]|nr:tetratricopeptide repeat protein [Chloroflexia bacterium]